MNSTKNTTLILVKNLPLNINISSTNYKKLEIELTEFQSLFTYREPSEDLLSR